MAYTKEQVDSLEYKELQEAAAELGHKVVGISKEKLKGYLLAAPQADPGDENPPTAPPSDSSVAPTEPPKDAEPTAVIPKPETNDSEDKLGWRPMIWVRGACARLGVSLAGVFGASDLREKIQETGLENDIESMAEALGFSETIKPDLISEPVILHDKAGDYSLSVYSDGSAEVVKYEIPNRIQRLPGQQIAGDMVVRFPDLFGFAELALDALDRADSAFGEVLVKTQMAEVEQKYNQEQAEKPINLPEVMNPKLIYVWLDEQREIYGFPAKLVSNAELPYKVCEALGIEHRKSCTAADGSKILDANGNTVPSAERVGYDEAVELIKTHIMWNEDKPTN